MYHVNILGDGDRVRVLGGFDDLEDAYRVFGYADATFAGQGIWLSGTKSLRILLVNRAWRERRAAAKAVRHADGPC